MKKIVFILILFAFSSFGLAQESIISLGLWNLNDISGDIQLMGHYRFQDINKINFSDNQNTFFYSGGVRLNTKSYIWHPNFLLLDIGGEINPASHKDFYIVMPDKADVRTMQRLDIKATFFNRRPITLSTFAKFSNSKINRENLANYDSNSKEWGIYANYNNKILPVNLKYNWTSRIEDELLLNRVLKYERQNTSVNFTKSFSELDNNSLVLTSNQYNYQLGSSAPVVSSLNNINLNNSVSFDENRRYTFNSSVIYADQRGLTNFNRIGINERISIELPYKFRLNSFYNYLNSDYNNTFSKQNVIGGSISHQLYLSLKSNISYSNYNIKSNSKSESRNKGEISFNYSKRIPTGKLRIDYAYQIDRYDIEATLDYMQINDEHLELTDGQIRLLDRENIEISSIVVKDATGTIIYTSGLDYQILENGNFIEIQRIPGGLISNGDIVLIDYQVLNSGPYKYDLHTNRLSVSIALFKKLLELYYRGTYQNYSNMENPGLVSINAYDQNILGARVMFDFLTLGFEYDDYSSTILPYKLYNTYLRSQKQFNKFLVSVNASYKKYHLSFTDSKRIYWNIDSKLAFKINAKSNIDLTLSYQSREQSGELLSFFTGDLDYTISIKQLYISAGIDFFHRIILSDEYVLGGINLKAVRRF